MAQENLRQHILPEDVNLTVPGSDSDMYKWFLLCFLFGKPLRAETVIATWEELLADKLDTPWDILGAKRQTIIKALHRGGYKRYDFSTVRGLNTVNEQLLSQYEGSLSFMLESSQDLEEFRSRLLKLYGVGPKVSEIFLRPFNEYFMERLH